MKQTAKTEIIPSNSYEQLINRKQTLFFDILIFDITQELISKNLKSKRILVIVSDKHQCSDIAFSDWPDDRIIQNPITGGETAVFISRTKGIFLDEEGEFADLQLEVHPLD